MLTLMSSVLYRLHNKVRSQFRNTFQKIRACTRVGTLERLLDVVKSETKNIPHIRLLASRYQLLTDNPDPVDHL